MKPIIQNILVFLLLALAIAFLVKKYVLHKPKANKSCGNDDGCGCH